MMKKIVPYFNIVILVVCFCLLEEWKNNNYLVENYYQFFMTGTRIYYVAKFLILGLLTINMFYLEKSPTIVLVIMLLISLIVLLTDLVLFRACTNFMYVCYLALLPSAVLFGGCTYFLIKKKKNN